MTRMLNHSCDAACHFVEMINRANVVVMVVAKRTIEEGEEVTVDYVDPWFGDMVRIALYWFDNLP
ncbi:hypothetical protein PPTG_10481 [Phytophthora nicotianae INRA-310]|uniref:SET domain-containing protein n=1 Tax=Phytophthora nicotianae (strain INRA-310) TaxID=761204 RepID=W2QAY8_PHYN3|nr:hypothetical protein PPTG_10481 [Phytophthora nicotianae INRA-310]ETN10333.1 hypothetical protein PPTG_10481 [Phytophthora nicotianae INRA-310]